MKSSILFVAVLSAALAQPACAEIVNWRSDDHGTMALLTIDHSQMFNLYFIFPQTTGSAAIDSNQFTRSRIEFEINPAVVLVANAEVGRRLIGGDFLDAAHYPSIGFLSDGVEQTSEGLKLSGVLSLHGMSRPVSFTVDPLTRISTARGAHFRGLTLHTTINRRDFGMIYVDPDRPVTAPQQYADQINLTVVLELVDRTMAPPSRVSR